MKNNRTTGNHARGELHARDATNIKRGFRKREHESDPEIRVQKRGKIKHKKHNNGAYSAPKNHSKHVDLGLYRDALADLARSGLDKKDFRLLRLEVLDRDQAEDFVNEDRACYKIPYFDLDGERTAYSRVRFLESKKHHGFKQRSRDGTHRYSQPFNSPPHAYFPPYLNWRDVANDATQKIIITEGEKKAAVACKLGLCCLALSGVYAFMSSKRHQELIPDLAQINWEGREVEIVFDADVMQKSEVNNALIQLIAVLTNRGPKSISKIFFSAEGGTGTHTGLDDYLVEHSIDDFEKLERQASDSIEKINSLNQLVCYIEKDHAYFDIKNGTYFKNFTNVKEAFANFGIQQISPQKFELIVESWNRHPNRRAVNAIDYMPGKLEVVDGVLNTWKPPIIAHKRGNVERWLDIVRHVMRDSEYVDWFLRWLAYPVQHPGAKLFSACFIYGAQTGVGKTFVVDPVMEFVYGVSNFHRMSAEDLTDKHNTFAGKSQFVVTNEVWLPEWRDRTSAMSMVKDMITRESVTINEKFAPKMRFTDHCNYYFTSNHAEAFIVEPNDRRLFVIEAPNTKFPDETYRELDEWLRYQDGAAMIRDYLLEYDCSDFNPKSQALQTRWRKELITVSKDPLTDFADQLRNDPNSVFMVNGVLPTLELYRAEDICRLFELTHPKFRFTITAGRMARLLKVVGMEKRHVRVNAKSPLMTLYALFRHDEWGESDNKEWAEHYLTNARMFGGKGRH